MTERVEPVSHVLQGSKFASIAPYIRDEQYGLRDLTKLRAVSRGWSVFGVLLSATGLAGAGWLYHLAFSADTWTMVAHGSIILGLQLGGFLWLYRAFLRMRAATGHFPELAAFDQRPPILYLRHFASENPEVTSRFFVTQSFEHVIAFTFWNLGRIVGLGDPKQRRLSGSVSRLFVSDEGWQETVRAVMAQSDGMIIHYVAGANVDWEVDQSELFPDTPRLVLMTQKRRRGLKRVSDLPAPPPLRAAVAASNQRLQASLFTGDTLVASIRGRDGETIRVCKPTVQNLWEVLLEFKGTFPPTALLEEQLPASLTKLRETLHAAMYRPLILGAIGISVLCAFALIWGFSGIFRGFVGLGP